MEVQKIPVQTKPRARPGNTVSAVNVSIARMACGLKGRRLLQLVILALLVCHSPGSFNRQAKQIAVEYIYSVN